ncbi:hypothetical protein N7474_007685 [Penicillium riverlandense]|uniref:uncharacterized protein n=1 Tax=Penicillium riverlandense TaxID=1903569 RepID=UPI00254709BF|nr:uncharacterized protein N7474_007685 [Penicillium riverlandense]KAJ5811384.1 hypothetical protein N7474_007685 [Penicillium riverlandense]
MQFSRALIALVAASLASAQGLPNIPSCSLNCFMSALGSDGCSDLLDFACHCQKPGLVSKVTPCVKSDCDVADQVSVSNAVVSQCSSAGHPIDVPPVLTTTSDTTTTTTTTTTTSASESSSSASAAPTTTTTAAASSGPASSSKGSSTPVSPSKTGGSSPSSTPGYNAASNLQGGMAGVVAAAAAVAYVL